MGFSRLMNKVTNFGKKIPGEINGIGGKIIGGLEKGLRVGNKILDVAGKATNALENVPVIGEIAAPANALIKQGQGVFKGAANGLDRANNLNNKIGRL